MKVDSFNVREYLNSKGIQFWTSGRNVSPGWTNIKCIFCDDLSNHLGVSPEYKFHCWKCNASGSIPFLVREIEQCSWAEARYIVNKFSDPLLIPPEKKKVTGPESMELPKEARPLLPLHREYLEQRRYNPEEIVQQYGIRGTGLLGDFAYRIIIPVFYKKQLVNFVGRDVTGKSTSKYKSCPNEKAVVELKHCLYNIDNVPESGPLLIVEGPLDVWRVGPGCIATFGTSWTLAQVNRIREKRPSQIYIMFDGEETAIQKAYDLASALSGFFPEVTVLEMASGDPGELSDEDVKEVRRIFLKQ